MSVSYECCLLSGIGLCVRIPTKRGVSECDREASITRSPWPTRGCLAMGFSPMAQNFDFIMKNKKKVSCLKEMIASSPAEGMPNGAAIKL